ncbi:MAG: hypothetical protein HUU55_20485 [Myxococcales bacterium]|nr:hypothetical protein [Myxococcales bacterium]
MAAEGRFGALDRMSSREKWMVLGLVAGFVVVIVGAALWWFSSAMTELEDEIATNQELMREVETAAADYASVRAKCDAIQGKIESSRIVSLRIPVNNIARNVQLSGGKKLADEIGSLDKQVETPIAGVCEKKTEKQKKKRAKGKKGADVEGSNLRVEQDFEFRGVSIDALFDFLEGIERSEELLFVTRLDISRKFGQFDVAQTAQVTVATYKAQGTP